MWRRRHLPVLKQALSLESSDTESGESRLCLGIGLGSQGLKRYAQLDAACGDYWFRASDPTHVQLCGITGEPTMPRLSIWESDEPSRCGTRRWSLRFAGVLVAGAGLCLVSGAFWCWAVARGGEVGSIWVG